MCISYIGGKGRIGKWISTLIPTDIETYVEGFGGMFWVFFNMDITKYKNLKTVVYNDFNKLNSNLFKCIKYYDRLWDELCKYPCQKLGVEETPPEYEEMFKRFQKELYVDDLVIGDEPNFEVAAKYVYVLTQVFSGSKPETSNYIDYKGKYRCKVLIFMDKLKNNKYRDFFDRITFVENMDFHELVLKYDSPTTYFYMDPPYWKTENYYSNHNFKKSDHERLSNTLKNIDGKFGLSYYDFDELHQWYPEETFGVEEDGQMVMFLPTQYKWYSHTFKKSASSKKDSIQKDSVELFITNY
jgi:DNA adenine methylase